MKILITGAAGFIGYSLMKRLEEYTDYDIWGIDGMIWRNAEDDKIKMHRANQLNKKFWIIDMRYEKGLHQYLQHHNFDLIIHLAAMPGVRDSIQNAKTVIDNNLGIFQNVLEYLRNNSPDVPLIYASSSSVYGNKNNMIELITADVQLNPYALSKLYCEQMAATYNQLFGIATIGLRFFTVYGPFGRPDMVYFKWSKAILNDEAIELYGDANRDFTYIDSITDGIMHIINKIDTFIAEKSTKIFNMGNGKPIYIPDLIGIIEKLTNKKAKVMRYDAQLGEAEITHALTTAFKTKFNYDFEYPIEEGMKSFIEWLKKYLAN